MIRVLVVDDSPTICHIFRTVLESDPEITVVGFATNGQDAVQKASELHPSVITMDVQMPGLDGIEANAADHGAVPDAHCHHQRAQ